MNPPLAVVRYLAELDAALAARNAPDRDQIVTQIGEHIAQALGDGPDPDGATVAAVLAELGDPLRIADEATGPAQTGSTSSGDAERAEVYRGAWQPAATKSPILARSWIPVVAAALWVVGAAQGLSPLLLTTIGPFIAIPGGMMVITTLANIPLIASVVLVSCSPLFRVAERWAWSAAIPVAVLADLVGSQGRMDPSYFSPNATLAAVLMAIPPIAAVGAMVWISVRAYRRSLPAAPFRSGHAGEASIGA